MFAYRGSRAPMRMHEQQLRRTVYQARAFIK